MVWISYSLETDILTGLERARTLHSVHYTTQGVSLHTSSPCVQGDLHKTLSTCGLISSLPRQFYPFPRIQWSSVFSWPGDAEDTGRPGLSRCRVLTFIGSILAINQAGISWRPQPPELTPDTEPITGNTGPHYYRIILLFVIPCLVFIVRAV